MSNLGIKNNNPGNLRDPRTGNFQVFKTPQEGHLALLNDIDYKKSGKSSHIQPGATLSDFAKTWAPASDNNDPINYANTLAQHTGVDVNTPFDQIPTDKLAEAIKVAEGTSSLPSTQKKYSTKEFAQKIRDKYNAYQNIDDNTLVSKFVAKYPVYKDRLDTSINDTSNTGASLVQTDETQPKETLLNKVGSIVGQKGIAEDISYVLGGDQYKKEFDKMEQSDKDVLANFVSHLNTAKQSGNQAAIEHYKNLVENYKPMNLNGMSVKDVFPTAGKNLEQIVGDIGQSALGLYGGELLGGGKLMQGATTAEKIASGAMTGAKLVGAASGLGAMQENKGIADIATETAKGAGIGAVVGAGTAGVGVLAGKAISGARRAFTHLSADDISRLASDETKTVEEATKGMSAQERSQYFKAKAFNETEKLTQEKAATETKFAEDTKNLKDQMVEANKNVGKIAAEKTEAVKTEAAQVYTDMSGIYKSKVDEALQKAEASGFKKDIPIEDINAQIDSHLESDNLGLSQKIKEDLIPNESGTVSTEQILAKAKEYMKQISKTSLGGSRTFTASEYEQMQKYSTLMKVLEENGVDLKEANAFWKKWATVRKIITTEIRPFNVTGEAKTSFGKTLITATKKTTTGTMEEAQIQARAKISAIESAFEESRGLKPGTLKGTLEKEVADATSKLTEKQQAKLDLDKLIKETELKLKQKKLDIRNPNKPGTVAYEKFNAEQRSKSLETIKKVVNVALKAALVGTVGKKAVELLLH